MREREVLYKQQLPTQEEQAKAQAAQAQPTAAQEKNKESTPTSQSRRMLAKDGVKALGQPKWSRVLDMQPREQELEKITQSPKNKPQETTEAEAKKQQEGKEQDAKEKTAERRKSIIATVSAAVKIHDGLHATHRSMSRRNMSVNTAAHRKMSSSGGEVHTA